MYVCKVLCDTLLNDNLKNRSAVEKKYKEHKATLQRELRKMKNEWWSNIGPICLRPERHQKPVYSFEAGLWS